MWSPFNYLHTPLILNDFNDEILLPEKIHQHPKCWEYCLVLTIDTQPHICTYYVSFKNYCFHNKVNLDSFRSYSYTMSSWHTWIHFRYQNQFRLCLSLKLAKCILFNNSSIKIIWVYSLWLLKWLSLFNKEVYSWEGKFNKPSANIFGDKKTWL